jgi:hypothetical protein
MKPRQIRRSQSLSPFGVGSILDLDGESFVAADIYRWRNQGQVIHEPRLERMLSVKELRMAPASSGSFWGVNQGGQGIPYYRFPQWLFCSRCRRMRRWTIGEETGEAPICSRCPKKVKLTPMRFVMACPYGHLADVPWELWAHSNHKGKCEQPELEFLTRPGGSGLEYVVVRCRVCKAERSLSGIASTDSLRSFNVRCPGRQPWQIGGEARGCNAVPQVLQRGATNLTFASIESSIDIPPFSNWSTYNSISLQVLNTNEYRLVASSPQSPLVPALFQAIGEKFGLDPDEVKRIIDKTLHELDQEAATDSSQEGDIDELMRQEYQAFLAPDVETDPRDRFIKRHVSLSNHLANLAQGHYDASARMLNRYLSVLVQVIRLREVRVLRGFSRLAPAEREDVDGDGPARFSLYGSEKQVPPSLVPPDLGKMNQGEGWLPAIEVFGEGIFLGLNETELQKWEISPAVQERVQILKQRHISSGGFLQPPTARLVLLHTLAHILIRQLSFECGYSIASLRERIYAAEPGNGQPMAGILIYTAAGDAEGTLGGLVREGELDRIFSTVIKALQSAEWCSSDPLCRESKGQGFGAMNLAACHACALLPETSCTMANRLLDRVLLLGNAYDPELGFFADLLKHILETMDSER